MQHASVRSAMIMLGALAAAVALYVRLPFEAEVRKSLGLTVFIGAPWLTEALPLVVVALLVSLGALLLGFEGLSTSKALAPIVFPFLGGFALPVATPPNALVFGTGRGRQGDMLRAGGALDLVCVVVVTLWAWRALP